jgi:hypothetical protein
MHKTQGFPIEGVFSEMPQFGAQDTGTRPTDQITIGGADLRRQVPPKTNVQLPNVLHLLDNRQTGDALKGRTVW